MKTLEATGLETERLFLRRPEESDIPALVDLLNTEEVSKWLSRVPFPYREEDAQEWFERMNDPEFEGEVFAITLKATGQFMGTIGIHPRPDGLRASVGFWLGVPFWGAGYCTEAAREVLRFGFEGLGYQRIEAGHIPGNAPSANVQEKIGMLYEGTLRWGMSRFGEMQDMVLRAIIRPDWELMNSSGG